MAVPFENLYHLRKVAESAAKPCTVCYKPATSVLVTPDKKDFFYVCPSHPKDRGYATVVAEPGPTPEELERKRREEEERMLAEEIEKVKKEYEEKQKKKDKKDKKDENEKDKEKEGEEQEGKNNDKNKGKDKKETVLETKKPEEEPRIFRLHKTIFDSRLQRWKQQQIAKLNQGRIRSPIAFPSVPKDDPI